MLNNGQTNILLKLTLQDFKSIFEYFSKFFMKIKSSTLDSFVLCLK